MEEKIREILKVIRVKTMCDDTGIDYKRMKNFSSGFVKKLKPEEIEMIVKYIKKNFDL